MSNYKILSGSCLKIIAMVSMVIDHTAMVLLSQDANAHIPYFSIGHYQITCYFICRCIIGRLAFPIFAFLLVEGYRYTKNKRQYAINLFIFAVLSIIPWNLVHGSVLRPQSFNVLFTLWAGVIGMYLMDNICDYYAKKHTIHFTKSTLLVLSLIGIRFLRFDYGVVGVAYIILLYLLHDSRLKQFIATIATFSYNRFHQFNILAYIPIMLYNGKRGFIKGRLGKYIMYAFYPIHLLILWAIAYFLQK